VSGTLPGSASFFNFSNQFVRGTVAPIFRHLVTGSTAPRMRSFHWLEANAHLQHSHPRLLHAPVGETLAGGDESPIGDMAVDGDEAVVGDTVPINEEPSKADNAPVVDKRPSRDKAVGSGEKLVCDVGLGGELRAGRRETFLIRRDSPRAQRCRQGFGCSFSGGIVVPGCGAEAWCPRGSQLSACWCPCRVHLAHELPW